MSPISESAFDIIFVGGGTAAGVIAGRLAAADKSLKILILEAGPHTKDDLFHVQPARYLSHLSPDSKTVRFYVGNPSKELLGRSLVVPCGQCLGGGSSVNFTMYTRAAASDYDDWETVYGNEGWSSKELIPLLKKTETYQVKEGEETHGYSGPLKVSYGGAYTNIGKEYLGVAEQYDKTRSSLTDPNGLFDINGYGRWQKWIDSKTGRRSDVPHHFLYNQADNKNLQIETGVLVKRVVIENGKATGVEFSYNLRFRPNACSDVHVVKATRLVVVAGGTFGSPQVLERSGIGAKSVLEKVGVEQVVDLPGVGEYYQDHNVIFSPYVASADAETLDGIVRSNVDDISKWGSIWAKEGTGMMASNALDAGIKLRPSPEELKQIGPDFEPRWKEYFENAPDKPVMWMGPVSMFVGDPTMVPPAKYYAVGYFVEYPVANGHIHIKDKDDVSAAPDYDPAYLNNKPDLAILNWGYKKSREYARRMASYRGEVTTAHPVFKEDSKALCKAQDGPVSIDSENIEYTAEDEKAIDKYTRDFVQTAWHGLGTCSMKPREQGGVVDSKLNVYGVQNLKVADMSICPANVSANTYSTALVIGEKAALIIAEELGIKGV
ncbi:alcohol oxidase [Jaapia argillacea MUCL 33604]|uniref:Alcohol oxidase n=1 Tax=Jaapia argillacea MUCL 33604 TaxID=933084 RepID=A0A067QIR3_9AGAM|nr:alcohol oxidase [Jaapia argillacea MUCL 33604]